MLSLSNFLLEFYIITFETASLNRNLPLSYSVKINLLNIEICDAYVYNYIYIFIKKNK